MAVLKFKSKQEHLASLADRLQYLIQHSGITEAELARKTEIKQQVCNQILRGLTSNPRVETLVKFANIFGVTVGQLVGTEPLDETVSTQASCMIPLLDWESVISWVEEDKLRFSDRLSIPWLSCDLKAKNRAYAIRSNPAFEPFFDRNSIMIVNPSDDYLPGQFVVVSADSKAITVRRLVEDLGIRFLNPILPGVPAIKLEAHHRLLGTVIEIRMNLSSSIGK